MDEKDIHIGSVYRQTKMGQHIGQLITVIRIGDNFVEYKPKSKGYTTVSKQRVNIKRFCLMFEEV